MTAYRGIVQESCSWQLPIANQVTVPTGTEAKGTRYIVKAVATGVFTGKETYVATAKILNPTLLTDWYFDLPVAGWALWDATLNLLQIFGGATWAPLNAVPYTGATSTLNMGVFPVGASQFVSSIAIGNQPLQVTSTTRCDNLNADLLDGQHGAHYEIAGNCLPLAGGSVSGIIYMSTPDARTSALQRVYLYNATASTAGVPRQWSPYMSFRGAWGTCWFI